MGEEDREMDTLNFLFVVLQFLGVWRPLHWSSVWKIYLYGSYTFFMTLLMITVLLSRLIELFNSTNDPEAFANNSFMLLTLIADCSKGLNMWLKRDDIIELTSVLRKEPCLAKNSEELAIQRKFDRLIRSNTLRYGALAATTLFALLLITFMEDVPKRSLPYEAWLPFDHFESILGYTIAYSHQIVTVSTGALISTVFDTLIPGLMMQTCAQLNILKERFHQMPKTLLVEIQNSRTEDTMNSSFVNLESKLLGRCVKHHLQIFELGSSAKKILSRFAEKSNDIFSHTIFLQYTVSTIVLCVSVFELSKIELFSPEFTAVFMYLFCMGVQIFVFCFYGCEVTNESLTVGDAVYEIDWETLSASAKRSLLTIMARTLRPIEYTSGHVITLNLDYFNSLLKLSYSAYNVLQQS